MPHWEEGRSKPKKTFTQFRWTDTVIEGLVLVEDKSNTLDENGKMKVRKALLATVLAAACAVDCRGNLSLTYRPLAADRGSERSPAIVLQFLQ